ncbi:MAG: RNHCP domain-containing protein [Candidatus Dojkabacteria bacterium]
MEEKKFRKNNESFVCLNCGKLTPPHPSSSRDHCMYCLYSLHVDINPGDRMNTCKGLLKPIGLRTKNSKEQIVYKCLKCSKIAYCIISPDDDRSEIVRLGSLKWVE